MAGCNSCVTELAEDYGGNRGCSLISIPPRLSCTFAETCCKQRRSGPETSSGIRIDGQISTGYRCPAEHCCWATLSTNRQPAASSVRMAAPKVRYLGQAEARANSAQTMGE